MSNLQGLSLIIIADCWPVHPGSDYFRLMQVVPEDWHDVGTDHAGSFALHARILQNLLLGLIFTGVAPVAVTQDALRNRIAVLNDHPPPASAWVAEWKSATTAYQAIVIDAQFEGLTTIERLLTLRAAAYCAFRAHQFGSAKALAMQATQLSDATAADWLQLFHAAAASNELSDAANALDRLITDYPTSLVGLDPDALYNVSGYLFRRDREGFLRLAQGLFDLGYRYYGAMEPDALWRDLAQHLLQSGKLVEARRVANRILHVSVLIDLQANQDTAALLDSHPYKNKVRDALRAHLKILQRLIAEHPRNRLLFSYQMELLARANRNEEILRATDQMLARIEMDDPDLPAFENGNSASWIYNERAYALWRQQRWDQALIEMQRGSALLERDQINTSQSLNLAELQCHAGKASEARVSLGRTGSMSAYGKMVFWSLSLCAAQALGDSNAAHEALNYLREHRNDSPKLLQDALLAVNDMPAAATILIERLSDIRTRGQAMSDLQVTLPIPPGTALEQLERERMSILLTREDVRDAIRRAGQIRTYDLRF
jgi:tetratricopeptide (TPR) repeat protein